MDSVRLRPIYTYHVSEGKCVYLFSETTSYVLNGNVFCTLIPFIASNAMSVEDIVIKTCDAISPEYILYALEQLAEAGLVADGTGGSSGEDVFWWANNIAPSEARKNLARVKVNIRNVGLSDNFADRLAGMFEVMGIEAGINIPSALTIFLVDDYLNKDLAAGVNELAKLQATWLAVKPVGNEIWVGPSSSNGAVCWDCVQARLMENRLGQHVLPDDVRKSVIPPTCEFAVQSDCALNMMAAYVARHIGTHKDIGIGGYIHVFDMDMLTVAKHFILTNPACACGNNSIAETQTLHLDFENSFTRYENGYRMASSAETYSKVSRLVSPITGLIPELCRSEKFNSSYIYYAKHGFSISEELSANRISGRPAWACGKGSTDIDARVSCIAEAIERYSSGYFGNEPTVRARYGDLENAIHPGKILLFSDNQYANRHTSNSSHSDFNWVPERLNEEIEIAWKECASLDNGDCAYIPARLCYLNYPENDGNQFCRADSNGCATGNTLEEALLFGLFELIERDAVSIWWFNKLVYPVVDLASFHDYAVDRVIESLKPDCRELIALDVTSDLGIYTFACISWNSVRQDQIYIGYGTHLEPVIAIKRALNEVIQVASYMKEHDVSGNHELSRWMHDTTLLDLPFLAGNRAFVRSAEDYRRLETGNLVTDISTCVDTLRAKDLKPYFVNMTRDASMLPTVRVVVPGLRHFWHRFAPGRLYDVPVEMGLLAAKTPERDLNRCFYPL